MIPVTSLRTYLPYAVSAVVVMSCGAPPRRTAQVQSSTPVERLFELLEQGGTLYGLDAGCGEWRAGPEPADVMLTASDDENRNIARDPQEHTDKAWRVEGRITARKPDAEGRMYGFSYQLTRVQDRIHMNISGRGSWSPAPGVELHDPKNPSNVVFGSATYCTARDVDLRASAERDTVLVAGEPWFLSRDACMRARTSLLPAQSSCFAGTRSH